jgi:hypothetical protein
LKQLIRKRNRAFKRYQKTKRPEHFEVYRSLRNSTLAVNRRLKFKYDNDIQTSLSNEINKITNFWHLAKNLMGDMTSFSIPTLVNQDGSLTSDPIQKANSFNEFFAQQCCLCEEAINTDPSGLPQFTQDCLCDIEIDVINIYECLLDLDVSKATGPDLIGNRILKNCATPLARPLQLLFEHSLNTEQFPSIWKNSHVIPIHKKGSRQKVENYRPISLLNNMSKIFEKVIYKSLYSYLSRNSLLTSLNSGFKKGDGAINQLIYITHKIYEELERKNDVHFVFLDFSKAFDKVWHKGLIYKLRKMGINGHLLGLLENYLSERTQKVVISGIKSDHQPVRAGVQQGSILGPLLFLVYINDLPDCVSSNISLFADDTTLWTPVDDPIVATEILNQDLENVAQWSKSWHMSLNADKSDFLSVSCKRQPPDYPDLVIEGNILRRVTSHRHLGITISSNMSWTEHIDNVCATAGIRLNILRKLGHKLSRRTLELLYKAYIRPLLEYGSVIFSDSCSSDALKLDQIQNQAALICTGALFTTNRSHLIEELSWPSLGDRRNEMRACIAYKALHDMAPKYLSDIYTRYIPNENQRYPARHRLNLLIPKCRTERFRRSFLPMSIRLWNSFDKSFTLTWPYKKFRALLKKRYRSKQSPVWYYTGKKRPNLLLTRLRLNNSTLSGDLYRNNLTVDSACSCGFHNEDRLHYLMDCPMYATSRDQLLRDVCEEIGPGVDVLNVNLSQHKQNIVNLLLFGSFEYSASTNMNISSAVQTFITKTGRFAR